MENDMSAMFSDLRFTAAPTLCQANRLTMCMREVAAVRRRWRLQRPGREEGAFQTKKSWISVFEISIESPPPNPGQK
jgi:hypothetical protein